MQIDPTHYEVLQVREDASLASIKAAHRKLMRSLHPDVNPASAAQAAAVNHARHVLAHPERRDDYDHDLAERRAWAQPTPQRHTAESSSTTSPQGHDPAPSEVWGEEVSTQETWGEQVRRDATWSEGVANEETWGEEVTRDETWGQEVPWGAQESPPPHSQHAPPQGSPYRHGDPDPSSASPRPVPARNVGWRSRIGIFAWSTWWLGTQVFVAVVTRTGYADIAFTLVFVATGWLAARKRMHGGSISAGYVLWLASGVLVTGIAGQSSITEAVLWGVVYVSWIAAAEGSNRLSRR
ncbi:MAG: DnaJ domain-containing protein [Ornithinimicrobium sp.]